MMPLVSVRGLRFRYPDGTDALQGIDFDLGAGETVALFGANGSGKTTFALHLNGLLSGEGEVLVAGLPVCNSHLPEIRRRVGLLFQDPDEQLFMPTVLEDVAFGPRQSGLAAPEALARARSTLERVALDATVWDKPPYHLSAGQKQRAALAGILAMEPELLVLDEPTTHLDPHGRRHLARLLASLPQAKIIVTHDAAFARLLARRAVFFERGLIVADGPLDEVVTTYGWDDPPAGN